jgi:hypothetical protein
MRRALKDWVIEGMMDVLCEIEPNTDGLSLSTKEIPSLEDVDSFREVSLRDGY